MLDNLFIFIMANFKYWVENYFQSTTLNQKSLILVFRSTFPTVILIYDTDVV